MGLSEAAPPLPISLARGEELTTRCVRGTYYIGLSRLSTRVNEAGQAPVSPLYCARARFMEAEKGPSEQVWTKTERKTETRAPISRLDSTRKAGRQ